MYKHFFKRLIDMLLSALALLAFSPVLLLAIVFLLFVNKGKVFFLQKRPGYREKPFHIIKLKTMTDEKDSQGELLPNEMRLTKTGAFLRKYSVDELPQLLNVLKGDMSLVGPRPLKLDYLPLYNDWQRRRHEVKPGITGLAQVNGRSAATWEARFRYDVSYVDNLSLALDLKILLKTVGKVVSSDGADPNKFLSTKPFEGNK